MGEDVEEVMVVVHRQLFERGCTHRELVLRATFLHTTENAHTC